MDKRLRMLHCIKEMFFLVTFVKKSETPVTDVGDAIMGMCQNRLVKACTSGSSGRVGVEARKMKSM